MSTETKRVPKSQLVRDRIALAKTAGETEIDVINWAMAELGQSRALATRYVAENWNRAQVPARGTCKATVGTSIAGLLPGRVTNAARVREIIAEVKSSGGDQSAAVERAVAEVGQKPAIARQYVAGNWDRV